MAEAPARGPRPDGPGDAPAPIYERAIRRERAARERAEALLESKALELYHANQALREQHARVQLRNDEMEKAHAALQMAQAQLIQSEKMASVGLLAAGVAHEINNPMAFIISNLGTMKRHAATMTRLIQAYRQLHAAPPEGGHDAGQLDRLRRLEEEAELDDMLMDVEDLLSESLEGAARVRDIVQGLKAFSRVDAAQCIEADLHAGLESTLKVVANELKYKCTVEKHYGDLPLVHCNLAKINQVFMNLLVNAAQAIERQGTITLRTWTDGGYACVEVRDDGCGIPPDKLGSIFDPFYTTKPVGSGTGLGLSISYGIVQEHGGQIAVHSEPGLGTAFLLKLPLVAAPQGPSEPSFVAL